MRIHPSFVLCLALLNLPCHAQSDEKGPVKSQLPRVAPQPPSDDKGPVASQMGMTLVPNVVGKTLDQAKQLLQEKKLTWKSATIAINAGRKSITKQSIAPGSKVKEGTQVILTIAQ